VQLEILHHVPCRNLRVLFKKNAAIGKLWRQLRFAFNVIFQILQYSTRIDVKIGEHISSIVKEGQALKTLGAYRTSSSFDIGHLFACGRAPGTNQQYNVNEAETKPLSSS